MPLQPIPVTESDRESAIATQIYQIIATASSQIGKLHTDQPALPEQQQKDPRTGDVIRTIPAQPAVTKAGIDARLGATNTAIINALQNVLNAAPGS